MPIRSSGKSQSIWKGQYGLADFDAVLEALKKAFATHYLIRDIPQILSQIHRPKLILRHDVLYSPAMALKIAQREHEAGISAAFMVSLDSPYYRLSHPETHSIFRAIVAMGNEIGLLQQGERTASRKKPSFAEAEAETRNKAGKLQELLGIQVQTIAFHRSPPEVPARSLFFGGNINASAPLMMKWTLTDNSPEWNSEQLVPPSTKPYEALLQVIIHPGYWGSSHCDPRERIKKLPRLPEKT